MARGADLYAGGRYIEAAEVFERTEPRLANTSTSDRARYGLYRGATLLALGDTSRAEAWLSFSLRITHQDPGVLSREENEMLTRALSLVATQRVNYPEPRKDPTAVATTKALPSGEPQGN